MEVKIHPSWLAALATEWEQPYFRQLAEFVRSEYARHTVYPPASRIFAAFDSTPFSQVKVVIIGQDPYHGEGMACGLSFSVPQGVAVPRSLANIYREIETDLGRKAAVSASGGDLTSWASQGVLLLNSVLTVRAAQPGSHRDMGWERLTDAAISALSNKREHLVFMLWGSYAARKAALIDPTRHLVLTAPHPSPLSASRGFFGCRHFSAANSYLSSHNIQPINW